jgi:hypothetical protein
LGKHQSRESLRGLADERHSTESALRDETDIKPQKIDLSPLKQYIRIESRRNAVIGAFITPNDFG